MADRYWVGGTGNWTTTSTTNWSASINGAGGASVPTAADSVFFDQAGPYTVTMGAGGGTLSCLDFTVSGASVTFAAGASHNFFVYGSFTLAATTVWNQTWGISFQASTTGKTITTNGVVLPVAIGFNGPGAPGWTLGSALNISTGTITHSAGTFNTDNYTLSCGNFTSSTSSVRAINLGSSTFNIGLGSLNFNNQTNLTFNAGTSTINFGAFGGGASSWTIQTGVTFYNVTYTAGTGAKSITGSNTFNNLVVTAPSTAGVTNVTFAANQTINGTLSTTGTAGNRRVFFASATYGISFTLTVNSAPSLTDADFRGLYVIGTAAPISGTRVGNRGECRGITFSTPKTVYWGLADASGGWSANAWALTNSGAVSTDNFPLPQDTATFTNTNPSVFQQLNIDGLITSLPNINFSGRTTAMTFSFNNTDTICYGNWTTGSGITYTNVATTLTFCGGGTQTITSAGKTLGVSINVNSYGGTVQLADALTIDTGNVLNIINGTFNTAGFAVTAGNLASSNSNVRTINLGASTVTLNGVVSKFTFSTTTNLTFNAGTSNIIVNSDAGGNWSVVDCGPGLVFYDMSVAGDYGSDTQQNQILGACTFRNLTVVKQPVDQNTRFSFNSNITVTGTLTVSSTTAVRRIILLSTIIGTRITITAGAFSGLDCDFRDINLAGAAAGAAPTRAGDCGNNLGITFPAAKTVYWNLAGSQNWSAIGWATSSGGTPAVNNFPLAQDTAVFNNAGSAGTVTINRSWNIGTFDASLRTTGMTLSVSTTTIPVVYGNWLFGTGITSSSTTGNLTFSKNGTQTITSNGRQFSNPITINNPLANVQLADALSLDSSSQLTLTSGTFDAVTYNVTTGLVNCQGTGFNLKMGSGTWTLSGTSGVWSMAAIPVITSGTSTIVLSNTSTTARTFSGADLYYNKLTIGGATGTSTLTILGNNTFGELASTKAVAHTILFSSGQTQTIGKWSVTGTVGNVVTVGPVTAATIYTLVIAGPANTGIDYLSVSYCTVSTTSPGEFYVGANSLSVAGNTGSIIFTATPSPRTLYWVGGGGNWSSTITNTISGVDILVVGGGGAGGHLGGGGAGGHRYTIGTALTANTNYTVTVGAGGPGGTAAVGTLGQNSVFNTITAGGGGGGASESAMASTNANASGGGGGGTVGVRSGAPGNGGPGIASNGGNGNDNGAGTAFAGGGGGGAGSVGIAAPAASSAGVGGTGVTSTITGTGVTRAAGGGGGAYLLSGTGTAGGGGGGGAGNGGRNGLNATSGSPNTGSGGGGNGLNSSGNLQGSSGGGGSGVVILRYPNTFSITNPGGGLTFTTDSASVAGFNITTFTAGTGTVSFAKTKWATSSGGSAGAAIPTSLDAVIFDSASSATAYTATIDAGVTLARCASFTMAGPASGNVTFAGTVGIAFHGNVSFAATGITRTYSGAMNLAGNSSYTFTPNGVGFTASTVMTVVGVGSTWTLGGAISQVQFAISAGSFFSNGYSLNVVGFVGNNNNVYSISLGSSTITLGGGSVGLTGVNGTLNSGTSTFLFNGGNAFSGGGKTYYNITWNPLSGTNYFIFGNNTFNNMTINGNANIGISSLLFYGNQTIGTLTLNGGATAAYRNFLASDTIGTTRTLTCAAFAATDVDFRDITIAGSISSVTFNTPGAQTWTVPAGVTSATIKLWGAGGGSGGNGYIEGGGGGGGGAFASKVLTVTPAQVLSFTVGVGGGAGGYNGFGQTVGTTGGASTHSAITAGGGLGGGDGTGGAGGTASGGDVNTTGQSGFGSFQGANSYKGGLAGNSPNATAASAIVPYSGLQPGGGQGGGGGDFAGKGGDGRVTFEWSAISLPVTGTRVGDAKGNSGITFGAGTTKYWNLAAGGNWNSTGWATLSGGTPAVNNFPLAQDTCLFEATGLNSAATVTVNAGYHIGTIDMSARTSNTMTLDTGTTTPSIYGNWINGTGTTLSGTGTMTFAGRTTQTITSAGKTFTQGFTFSSPSGAVTLQDSFICSSSNTVFSFGTFNANNYNVSLTSSFSTVATSGSNLRTIAVGSGTWILAGQTAWSASTSTNLTVTGTGTFSLTNNSAKSFQGGGVSYSGITLDQGGAGTLTITGNNTFANISNSYSATGATTISIGTTTQTVTRWTATGAATRVLTVQGTSASNPSTLILTGATKPTVNYLSITGVRAYSLVDTWYVLPNSTNNGSLGFIYNAELSALVKKLYLGGSNTLSVYYGSKPVNSIYYGSVKIFG